VAFTIDANSPYTKRIYINGVESTYSATSAFASLPVTITAPVVYGRWGTQYYTDCDLLFAAMHTSLTPAQIAAHYALGITMAGIKAKPVGDNLAVMVPGTSGLGTSKFGFRM
jgi:hypothetical protein